jgi:diguanylate cyclase (GGDEF)-like protein/PAS domain S-box-containing protein
MAEPQEQKPAVAQAAIADKRSPATTSLNALREQAAGLRRAQLMASLAHVVTGPDGAFESWSETLPTLIGVPDSEVAGSTRQWLDLVHPDDRALFRDTALAARAHGRRSEVQYRLWRSDGNWIHVRQMMEPIAGSVDAQGHSRWFNTLQDITAIKAAEDRYRRLVRVYAVLSGINSLIVRTQDRDELFKAACELLVREGNYPMAWIGLVNSQGTRVIVEAFAGEPGDTLRNGRLSLVEGGLNFGLPGQALKTMRPALSQDLERDPQARRNADYQARGIQSACMIPLILGGRGIGVLGLYASGVGFFDDEELRLLLDLAGDIAFAIDHIDKSEQAAYASFYDQLTGLANRVLLHERVEQSVRTAARESRNIALVMLDIERFRSVNESLGRRAGDELLKQVTARLTTLVRDTNWVARMGSDVFAVMVPDVSSAEEVASRTDHLMRGLFAAAYRFEQADIALSGRAGIALFPNDAPDADALLLRAEAALKKAKSSGERYFFYEQRMGERVSEHMALESQLRRALGKNEFVLHYQPKVEVDTRNVVGVEALIRWQHPELGLVPPTRFIPILEETGLILDVGSWVLKRASLDRKDWLERGLEAPRVAVNVSLMQLRQRNFVHLVEDAIVHGATPAGIDLELTESLLMDDIEANIAKLKALRALGLEIAIDDFGTGYSSLAYLAKLPVQALKIDRSFINGLHKDPDAMTLASTMISLAHSLRLQVVAEGVETEEQAHLLRLLRCDQMQGWLVSKAVPAAALVELLSPARDANRP